MRVNNFIAFIAICILFAACANPKNLEYQNVKNFRILNLSLQPDIGMDVQFYNPNTFGVTMKEADINVFINDKMIGTGRLQKAYAVPASDTFLLPVVLKADLKSLFSNTYSILSNRLVTVKLQGHVKAGKGVFVNIPINYEGKQQLNVADFK
jgi:LEA14-like dessication related protein